MPGTTRELTYAQALSLALAEEIEHDPEDPQGYEPA
jgi:hypothetical protein